MSASGSRHEDREFLKGLDKDQLIDLIFAHVRSLWSVDGLYYIGIEERFGTEAATQIDIGCWRTMGTIECRRLRKVTGIDGTDLDSFEELFKRTSWALDMEDREYERKEKSLTIRNKACRVQMTRKKKGLVEFECKAVRIGFMEGFAREFNPEVMVVCSICPPGEHPVDLWCEWTFILE